MQSLDDLLPILRSPGKLGRLRLASRRDGAADDRVEALLLDDASRVCFPVVGGIPRLLPSANHVMTIAAAALDRFNGVDGYKLPPFGGGGVELDHYEVNGVHDVTADPYDHERILAACGLVPDNVRTLVDVGAGPGTFLARLGASHPSISGFGLERSSAAVAAAPSNVAMLQGTADALPLADGCVDCCVSMETLEHLPDPVHRAALAEMGRVSRRYVLVNVPYRERRLQVACRHCGCVFNPNYHMRSYDDELLASLLPGFEVRERLVMPRRENLLKAIAAPLRSRVFGPLDYAICPQCGMSGADTSDPGRVEAAPSGGGPTHDLKARSKQLVRAVAERLPSVPVRGEILVLYERAR